ncbi:hypothetical protein ACFXHA_29445 [Nocardia sp. NPDC059240]|uniref:hypothetical protein n=1 Tax=Nocardia sp. NPDC059240 TaxID=3346786 RepID=UPI0036CAA5DA
MHTTHRPVRRIGWGTTTLALAATVAALSAPTASADFMGPDIMDCSSGTCVAPSSYVVGQTYMFFQIPALDNAATTSFYDNGNCVGTITYPHSGPNAVPWVPTTAGTHQMAYSTALTIPFVYTKPNPFPVTVVAAPPGSPTPQPTQHGGCAGVGSGSPVGSGSSIMPGSS